MVLVGDLFSAYFMRETDGILTPHGLSWGKNWSELGFPMHRSCQTKRLAQCLRAPLDLSMLCSMKEQEIVYLRGVFTKITAESC